MFEHIAGIIAIIIGIFELYFASQYFKNIKEHGNQGTSSFSIMAFWSSVGFGIILIIIGIPLAI